MTKDEQITQLQLVISALDELLREMIGSTSTLTWAEEVKEEQVDPLQYTNQGGYPLLQSLRAMLLKWEAEDPAWPVSSGLVRQAKTYKMTLPELYAAISTDKKLAQRFRAYPGSGYR